MSIRIPERVHSLPSSSKPLWGKWVAGFWGLPNTKERKGGVGLRTDFAVTGSSRFGARFGGTRETKSLSKKKLPFSKGLFSGKMQIASLSFGCFIHHGISDTAQGLPGPWFLWWWPERGFSFSGSLGLSLSPIHFKASTWPALLSTSFKDCSLSSPFISSSVKGTWLLQKGLFEKGAAVCMGRRG